MEYKEFRDTPVASVSVEEGSVDVVITLTHDDKLKDIYSIRGAIKVLIKKDKPVTYILSKVITL